MNGYPIPRLSRPWSQALRLVGDGVQYHNDFCLIQDRVGRWHAIGIGGQDGSDATLFHAVGDALERPMTYLPKIASQVTPAANHMWAPFAFWANNECAYLYYAHYVEPPMFAMRVLVSRDPNLAHWTPLEDESLPGGNIVFEEPACRDACIFWDEALDAYIMYYAAGMSCDMEDWHEALRARTSTDLIHWSEPRIIMGPPDGYVAPESPFVLKRNGRYYLWVSGHDYAVTSLYISDNPFDFGDPNNERVAEWSGHAPEIITIDGTDYMACCAIASTSGGAPGEHDLKGVFIQPLCWEHLSG